MPTVCSVLAFCNDPISMASMLETLVNLVSEDGEKLRATAPPVAVPVTRITSVPSPPLMVVVDAKLTVFAAETVALTMSLPAPPLMLSLPPAPIRVSSPSPPVMTSLPPAAVIESLPAPPVMLSLPPPPPMVSAPAPPSRLSETVVPLKVSLPEPPVIVIARAASVMLLMFKS